MTSEFDPGAFSLLKKFSTPSVFLDVGTPGAFTSNIRVDTKNGMAKAVRHLVNLGHRDVLLIRNSQKSAKEPSLLSHQSRSEGFLEAIKKCRSKGARAHIVDVEGSGADAGRRAIQQALKSDHFTAVIATTDMIALGASRGLQDAGINIPDDISLVGFDNTYVCEFMTPPLTTIEIPIEELGRSAVQLLMSSIEESAPGRELTLPTRLILRKSTSAPPGS
jgi:LacI family transcriptional regulator